MQIAVGVERLQIVDRANMHTPIVQNLGPGDIYLGWEDVSVSNGLRLRPGERLEFRRDVHHPLWAVATLPLTDVRVLVVD